MAPPNRFSLDTTERLNAISDEIGMITQKLLDAVENHHPIDLDYEARLRDLQNELDRISTPESMDQYDGPDSSTNLPAL